ncbi:hypothetical protein SAV14893_031620 [Streptomyces avermitilis]|uniref:Secreted protein n=1 Tax=Streptomyces avermitilis TaxID=33903 RepID=A0A4D4MYE9_STRAX|nr:hypothetical protein SAVMC3_43600 [Streptomyces avermitilis]GDY63769.1 hypothetical protein SAV14893_031620 [Streptomyces avermitilis]GDY76087.1 hypothetical protein SAV31267_055720 [Streptomyces avermitilis]GDY85039.1 hypothetical protein SAVCW2_42380 [Streptomyces avermitilis]
MGRVPRTVRVSWPAAGAPLAKLTLPNVSAAAAPVTNNARLPIPWSSSHMTAAPRMSGDMGGAGVARTTLVFSRELPGKGREAGEEDTGGRRESAAAGVADDDPRRGRNTRGLCRPDHRKRMLEG